MDYLFYSFVSLIKAFAFLLAPLMFDKQIKFIDKTNMFR